MKSSELAMIRTVALAVTLTVMMGCGSSRSSLKVGKTADGEVVEAEGLAPNDISNIIETKRASLVDAQRNAIEKAVGVFVSARTLVEKAVAIENNILAKTDGYIKKYDILKESVDDGLYKTKIRALVALKDLEADLKKNDLLTTPELERPQTLIRITEMLGRNKLPNKPASAALEASLIEQGFVIIDEDRAKEADMLIEGKGSSFPFQREGLGGFMSYRARITLQARKPGAKKLIFSVSKEASGLGGNEDLAAMKSLETVGQLVGEEMGPRLIEEWNKGRSVLIFVEGAKTFEEIDRVKKHLSAQPGVKDSVLRVFDEDMAQFELQLKSIKSEELATGLSKSRSLPLKILESSSQVIRVKL